MPKGKLNMSELVHICDKCQMEIEDNRGVLVVIMSDVTSARKEVERQTLSGSSKPESQPVPSDSLLSWQSERTRLAHWRTYHDECYQEDAIAQYHIDLARLRTHEHLISWHSHLQEKNWLPVTDWSFFLARYGSHLP